MNTKTRRVAVVGGNRIPFARSNSVYSHASNQDMLTAALDGLIDRFNLDGETLGEVAGGAVLKHSRDRDLARESVLSTAHRPGVGEDVGASAEWKLGGDLGRRCAAVSGDRNPIHMHSLTAKPLGFPSAIAHGMWTKARCLAALESRLPDTFAIDVRFHMTPLEPKPKATNGRRKTK